LISRSRLKDTLGGGRILAPALGVHDYHGVVIFACQAQDNQVVPGYLGVVQDRDSAVRVDWCSLRPRQILPFKQGWWALLELLYLFRLKSGQHPAS
jgi:hypothetical protein